MKRNNEGELILNDYSVFRRSIKQALIDSATSLFGYYEDAEGRLYMNCNGEQFVKF